MRGNIWVSTGAFKTNNLSEILAIAHVNGIYNIELSSSISLESYNEDALFNAPEKMRFLVHNYFPPEPSNLVINLASDDVNIRSKTLSFCKGTIDLCRLLGSGIYSVHSGFCFDPKQEQLGEFQLDIPRQSKPSAKRKFWESLRELMEYATIQDVILCIENNVVPIWNLVKGKNEIDLMSSLGDYKEFSKIDELKSIRFLVDFGHLKVSANSENFDPFQFVETIADRTEVFHLSDNDGSKDENRAFDKTAWFFPILGNFSDKIFVIEAYNLEIEEIHRCSELIETAIS